MQRKEIMFGCTSYVSDLRTFPLSGFEDPIKEQMDQNYENPSQDRVSETDYNKLSTFITPRSTLET